ncbi:ABC transporter permease [Aureimonas fodinaquatilis]|uniref:ABC transporter permease n=1 Tax=Aureimonas fodinaquatilis TaxID=2565783 RepID=A0A5B0DSL6_9HYPH|nr:ABC transporter permease [Aureimonas fodinaquatilis]KAA0969002.1 ABC transporter permease [Aureimonas fodinaquatilis]
MSTHWVSDKPFDPERTTAQGTEPFAAYANASQRRLFWWRFRRHKLAVLSLAILILAYLVVVFAEMIAPSSAGKRDTQHIFMPPQRVHLMHEGQWVGPFVYDMQGRLDMDTLQRHYVADTTTPMKLRFFCRGEPYRFWGLVPGDRHLFCAPEGGTAYLAGTDRLGRDIFSRLVHGARISLTIGLIGVSLSLVLGLLLGGMAGYRGGAFDFWLQRVTEVLRSLPHLPIWLALAAALPVTMSPLTVYFCITAILALLEWPGLARAVRSKFLSLREEDFCAAAQMMGASDGRIIFRHLLPNFLSHIIVSAALSIPTMILAETALSFLGLGLRAPITSWGVMLTEAQNIEAVVLYPWLMLPMVPVIVVVLAFSFLGDGMRDAVDPLSG